MQKGFYYIENSVDEWHSSKHCFVDTLDEAKEAMKYCCDWYCERGTGKIYFQPTGVEVVERQSTRLEYDEKKKRLVDIPCTYTDIVGSSRVFVCRGTGLDKDGNVKWSDKEF